jgi:hypothetical protein
MLARVERSNHVRTDTGGEFMFAGASILTNRVFKHLPNLNCVYV